MHTDLFIQYMTINIKYHFYVKTNVAAICKLNAKYLFINVKYCFAWSKHETEQAESTHTNRNSFEEKITTLNITQKNPKNNLTLSSRKKYQCKIWLFKIYVFIRVVHDFISFISMTLLAASGYQKLWFGSHTKRAKFLPQFKKRYRSIIQLTE